MVLNVLRSRKIAKRVLLAILVLIIPPFVLWGVGSLQKSPNYIGTIDGKKIFPPEFNMSVQGMKIELILVYSSDYDTYNQIIQDREKINTMAWERMILLAAAKKEGIRVSDRDVISFLSTHPLFQRAGIFDRELYSQLIKNTMGLEPRKFEELVRENIMISFFQEKLCKNVTMSDEALLKEYQKLNNKYDLSFVLVDKDSTAPAAAPTEDQIKKYYEDNRDKLYTPARIDIEYMEIPFNNAGEKEQVKKKMEELYPRLLESPESFQSITESQLIKYQRTGLITRDTLIPGIKFYQEFYDIAYKLKKGSISPLFFSGEDTGGAYVLRKADEVPGEAMTFDQAHDIIAKKLSDDEKLALSKEKADALYSDIKDNKSTFENAATALTKQVKVAKNVGLNTYIEGVGPADQVVMAAADAAAGKVIPPVVTPAGYILVRVDTVIPADMAEFEKQKEAFQRAATMDQRREVLGKWLSENAPKAELRLDLKEI